MSLDKPQLECSEKCFICEICDAIALFVTIISCNKQVGVGEELQHEIPALEDHPAGVPENDSEAQPFIEGGGGIEIS